MGNIHTVTQVKPQFHRPGAAIKVRKEFQKGFEKEFNAWKVKDNTLLQRVTSSVAIPNINEDPNKFIPEACDLFLVIRSGSKYGYEDELNKVLDRFARKLEDAVFFMEDEYVSYVRRYEIRKGKFILKIVVKSDGTLLRYYRKNFPADKKTIFNILKAEAMEWEGIISDYDYKYALTAANKALKLNNKDWALLYLKGNALLTGGEYESARKVFHKALRLKKELLGNASEDFDCRNVYHAISLTYNHQKNYEDAISYAGRAYKITPTLGNYTPLESKGFALMGLGRFADAIKCFDDILRYSLRRTDIAFAFYNKACALSSLQQWTQAAACLSSAFMLDPTRLPQEATRDEALAPLLKRQEGIEILAALESLKPKG